LEDKNFSSYIRLEDALETIVCIENWSVITEEELDLLLLFSKSKTRYALDIIIFSQVTEQMICCGLLWTSGIFSCLEIHNCNWCKRSQNSFL